MGNTLSPVPQQLWPLVMVVLGGRSKHSSAIDHAQLIQRGFSWVVLDGHRRSVGLNMDLCAAFSIDPTNYKIGRTPAVSYDTVSFVVKYS